INFDELLAAKVFGVTNRRHRGIEIAALELITYPLAVIRANLPRSEARLFEAIVANRVSAEIAVRLCAFGCSLVVLPREDFPGGSGLLLVLRHCQSAKYPNIVWRGRPGPRKFGAQGKLAGPPRN